MLAWCGAAATVTLAIALIAPVVGDPVNLARALADFGPLAERLAAQFWPGPLTLVLPLRPGAAITPAVTAGLPTIAV